MPDPFHTPRADPFDPDPFGPAGPESEFEPLVDPRVERVARRVAGIVQMAPLDAVRAWLTGDFGVGEEDALCTAIRRDPAVDLRDDEIVAVFYEVLAEADFRADRAADVLTLLREAGQFREPDRPRRAGRR